MLLLVPLAAGGLITLLIQLVVICLVGYLFYWLITFLGPPEPIRKVAVVILVVVLVLVLLSLLFGIAPIGLR